MKTLLALLLLLLAALLAAQPTSACELDAEDIQELEIVLESVE